MMVGPEKLAYEQAAGFFVATVEQVRPEQWDSPGLDLWSVRDLAGHTGRNHDINISQQSEKSPGQSGRDVGEGGSVTGSTGARSSAHQRADDSVVRDACVNAESQEDHRLEPDDQPSEFRKHHEGMMRRSTFRNGDARLLPDESRNRGR